MIYLIADIDKIYCKIGFSKTPLNRLLELQTSSPLTLEILYVVDGTMSSEKQIHAKFIKNHIRGEWFHFDAEIIKYIRKMPQIDFSGLIKRTSRYEKQPEIFHSINPLIGESSLDVNTNISNLATIILKYLIGKSENNRADVRIDRIDKNCNIPKSSVYRVLDQLIRCRLISRANYINCYFINPQIFFKGDTITIVKQFTKEEGRPKPLLPKPKK